MWHLFFDETALWTMAVAAACNAACAIVGCFLVLRRLSLLGDAISHAVLPGIALAYFFTGALSSWPIAVGAMALGVLTALLTRALHSWGQVPEDASMGVVFTSLFALGVILIENLARDAHIDASCALYGRVEYVPLETVPLWGWEIPRTALTLAFVLLLVVFVVTVFWKELKLASFDEQLATSMGFHSGLIHYALMGLVAMVTVASFEAVGSILVVAMLIVPPATAHLLTDRLPWMIVVAVTIGILSAILGYVGDVLWQSNVAGTAAVAAGLLFALALIFSPRYGLLARLVQNFLLGVRIAAEDIVGGLYRHQEALALSGGKSTDETPPARETFYLERPAFKRWLALLWLKWKGEVVNAPAGRLLLSQSGYAKAQSIVRSHRLWESYLDRQFELPADHLHEPAEKLEHFIGPQLQEEIAAAVSGLESDPHGKEIPPAAAS